MALSAVPGCHLDRTSSHCSPCSAPGTLPLTFSNKQAGMHLGHFTGCSLSLAHPSPCYPQGYVLASNKFLKKHHFMVFPYCSTENLTPTITFCAHALTHSWTSRAGGGCMRVLPSCEHAQQKWRRRLWLSYSLLCSQVCSRCSKKCTELLMKSEEQVGEAHRKNNLPLSKQKSEIRKK